MAMLVARYWLAIPTLAIAGSLARKKATPAERRHAADAYAAVRGAAGWRGDSGRCVDVRAGVGPGADRGTLDDDRWMKRMAAQAKAHSLFDPAIVRRAVVDSFRETRSAACRFAIPVMFTVYVGSILTTGLFVLSLRFGGEEPPWFILAISAWLWFTVLFANFAEAMAEGRGKAQADALRRARHQVPAKKFVAAARPDRSKSRCSRRCCGAAN